MLSVPFQGALHIEYADDDDDDDGWVYYDINTQTLTPFQWRNPILKHEPCCAWMLLLPTTCYKSPSPPLVHPLYVVPACLPANSSPDGCIPLPTSVWLKVEVLTGSTEERAILSAGTFFSSSLIGGGGWRNRVWVPLKRLVRNRGCFKRTSDGEVVKRPAAASLSLHFLSRSCGATVVNLLCPFLDPCLWTLNYLDYYRTTHSLSSSCAATSLLE